MTKTRISVEMIDDIVAKCIRNTTAYKTGEVIQGKQDVGWSYHQAITIAASSSRSKQMELAHRITQQCEEADADYPMTTTSLQVDLGCPYKATIIIREY